MLLYVTLLGLGRHPEPAALRVPLHARHRRRGVAHPARHIPIMMGTQLIAEDY
jgi:hypothetical protein